jgi:hypothetical protein
MAILDGAMQKSGAEPRRSIRAGSKAQRTYFAEYTHVDFEPDRRVRVLGDKAGPRRESRADKLPALSYTIMHNRAGWGGGGFSLRDDQ